MRELLLPGRAGASTNCSRQTDFGVGEKPGSTTANFGVSEAVPRAPQHTWLGVVSSPQGSPPAIAPAGTSAPGCEVRGL